MMNRRSFLGQLRSAAIAVALSPLVARLASVEKTEAPKPEEEKRWVVNPAWQSAPYEASFVFSEGSYRRLDKGESGDSFQYMLDPFPMRFDANGDQLPPFIET